MIDKQHSPAFSPVTGWHYYYQHSQTICGWYKTDKDTEPKRGP